MREIRPQGSIYRNVSCVGQGQTATVFRAIREDSEGHSQQVVALKVLKNRTAVSWLRREFDTLAKINSPHCVKVLGWENLDEGYALVLEWIDGVTLFEYGKSINCESELIGEIVAQVQDGLRALRERGLFHGDLSPSNILIDRHGMVRIVDFALAPNEDGVIHGTPAYLAPELWQGERPSFEADLFALGLISEDLRAGFATIPDSAEACRKRAFGLTSTSGLLHFDSFARSPVLSSSQSRLRERLAAGVSDLLARKAGLAAQTQALATETRESKWLFSKVASAVIATMITMAASVQAQAPLSGVDRGEQQASVCIRTQSWFELSLNGKPVGFAPVCIRGLKPGNHRLSWRTGKGAAVARLTLGPNETLQLNQSQLESLGNR